MEIKSGICGWDMKRYRSIFTWNFSAFKFFPAPCFIQCTCATKWHSCKTLNLGMGTIPVPLSTVLLNKKIHLDFGPASIINFICNRKCSSALKVLRFEDTFSRWKWEWKWKWVSKNFPNILIILKLLNSRSTLFPYNYFNIFHWTFYT